MSQLGLDVESPLSFVPVDRYGRRGTPIPVEGGAGASWRAAEAWSYIAVQMMNRVPPGMEGEYERQRQREDALD